MMGSQKPSCFCLLMIFGSLLAVVVPSRVDRGSMTPRGDHFGVLWQGTSVEVGAHTQGAPEELLQTERRLLQGPDNHQLGNREFSESPRVAIPFDKIHFEYADEDWAVYDVTGDVVSDDVINGDVIGSSSLLREKMIVSVSPNVDKELTIRTVIKAFSNIRISYQVHMMARNARLNPSFAVYLVSNGTRALLREEDPHEVWSNSHVEVKTEAETELLFIGVLTGQGNQIALRSFTLQDLSSSHIPRRYGVSTVRDDHGSEHLLFGSGPPDVGHHEELEALKKSPVSVEREMMSDGITTSPTFQDSDFVLTTGSTVRSSSSYSDFRSAGVVQDVDSGKGLRYGTKKNYTFDIAASYLTYPNGSIHDRASSSAVDPRHYTTTSSYETVPDQPGNGTFDNGPSDNETSDAGTSSDSGTSNTTLSTSPVNTTTDTTPNETILPSFSSSTKGIINFFIGLVVCTLSVLAFLWWRKRRAKEDDEIPVFSRAASEHGNPTFADDEASFDGGLNTETTSNYRSFR